MLRVLSALDTTSMPGLTDCARAAPTRTDSSDAARTTLTLFMALSLLHLLILQLQVVLHDDLVGRLDGAEHHAGRLDPELRHQQGPLRVDQGLSVLPGDPRVERGLLCRAGHGQVA